MKHMSHDPMIPTSPLAYTQTWIQATQVKFMLCKVSVHKWSPCYAKSRWPQPSANRYRWNGSSANRNLPCKDFELGPQAWASAEYWSGTPSTTYWASIQQWYSNMECRWVWTTTKRSDGRYDSLSLYSTPLFTNGHRYKMCTRAYLNGGGLELHLSFFFFFVIMQGPYDAATLAFLPEGHVERSSTKLGRNTRVIVSSWPPLQVLPATREKGDEHCVRMSPVHWTPAEWRICKRWLNIRSSSSRYFTPPKDHSMKTLMN